MKENLKRTTEDPANQYYAYVTRDDLIDCFPDDSVILTIRNYDNYVATPPLIDEDESSIDIDESEDQSAEPRTLRVYGRWKAIDVRLVTNEGEALHTDPSAIEAKKEEDKNKKNELALYDIPPYLGGTSSSQPTESMQQKKRSGRSKRFVKAEENDTSDNTTKDYENEDERKIAAKALLGYRPPKKQLKRNLDEISDSFESR